MKERKSMKPSEQMDPGHDGGGASASAENQAIDASRANLGKRHVASESDERTVNNTVRHTYRVLNDAEKAQMMAIKDAGQAFLDLCQGEGREMSLARTNAEQAVMWAVKAITA